VKVSGIIFTEASRTDSTMIVFLLKPDYNKLESPKRVIENNNKNMHNCRKIKLSE